MATKGCVAAFFIEILFMNIYNVQIKNTINTKIMTIIYTLLVFFMTTYSHGVDDDTLEKTSRPCVREKLSFGSFDYIEHAKNDAVRHAISKASSGPMNDVCACISVVSDVRDTGTLCYDYALRHFLKDDFLKAAPPSLQNLGFKGIINNCLNMYCDMTSSPKEGILAVYYNRKDLKNIDMHYNAIPVHFGIVGKDGYITSKWGEDSMYRHSPFCVPKQYGDSIAYFMLKKDADTEAFKNYITHGLSLV